MVSINYKLGKEYTLKVVSSIKPHIIKGLGKRQSKIPRYHVVLGEDQRLYRLFHRGRLGRGRIIRCVVSGFNEKGSPRFMLAMSEFPKRKTPIDSKSKSPHLIFIPMGNKR